METMKKHTVQFPDGSLETRRSPRHYTHAVAVRVVSEARYFLGSEANAPEGALDVKLTQSAMPKNWFYGNPGELPIGHIFPAQYSCRVAVEPRWSAYSWHQGPANAHKGYLAATKQANSRGRKYIDIVELIACSTVAVKPRVKAGK